MAHWLIVAAMVPCIAFCLWTQQRAAIVLTHTTFFNALSVLWIAAYGLRHRTSRNLDGLLLLGSMVCLLAGNFMFVAPLRHGAAIRALVGFPFYTGFYLGLCLLVLRHLWRSGVLQRPLVIVTLLVGTAGLAVLQGAMLVEPMRATAALPVICLYLLIKSLAMMVLLVGSALIMAQPEHLFLQSALAMSVAGLAKAYDAFYLQQRSTCWAQAVWLMGCAALPLALIWAEKKGRLLWTQPVHFSEGSSVRALLGATVFGAMSLVIGALVALGIDDLRDPFVLTSVGLALFLAWFFANVLSLRWSLALRGTRQSMPFPTSSPDGQRVALPLIEQRSPLAEVNEVIDGYNQVVLHSNRLLVLSQDAALVRQAAEVAHDIRGPLVALRVASEEMTCADEDVRQLMDDAVQRIHEIASHLLDCRRGTDVNQEVELAPLVKSMVHENRLRYRHHAHLDVSTSVHAAARDLKARACATELRRALSNVITNAVEATQHAGRVQVCLHRDGDRACITVIDNGPGISPELLNRLGHNGFTHGKADGNGLGLAMVRRAMADCGGSVKFSSNVGVGTEVALLLPAWEPSSPVRSEA